jgi:hypothetical protein
VFQQIGTEISKQLATFMFRVTVLEKQAGTLVSTNPHGVTSHKIIIFKQRLLM